MHLSAAKAFLFQINFHSMHVNHKFIWHMSALVYWKCFSEITIRKYRFQMQRGWKKKIIIKVKQGLNNLSKGEDEDNNNNNKKENLPILCCVYS